MEEHLSSDEWRAKVRAAKSEHNRLRKRDCKSDWSSMVSAIAPHIPTKLGKRWYGDFTTWLKKMTTVESKNVGYLNMAWQKSILLYHAVAGCQSSTAHAELSMYLDSNLNTQLKLSLLHTKP